VTVTFEAPDQRYSNSVMQTFNSAVTVTLKNNTYLESSDGKRLFLEEYLPPGKDGFGAGSFFRERRKESHSSKTARFISFVSSRAAEKSTVASSWRT